MRTFIFTVAALALTSLASPLESVAQCGPLGCGASAVYGRSVAFVSRAAAAPVRWVGNGVERRQSRRQARRGSSGSYSACSPAQAPGKSVQAPAQAPVQAQAKHAHEQAPGAVYPEQGGLVAP